LRYLRIYLQSRNMILDRGHFSEMVYSDLWRGGVPFQKWETAILNHFARQNFITVLCTAPSETLKQRYREREYAQTIDADELTIVQDRFIELLRPLNVMEYSSTDERSLSTMVAKLKQEVTKRQSMSPILKRRVGEVRHEPQFILLEGSNGSGKSTLAKLLKVNLVGWSVQTLDYEPDERPFRRFLSQYGLSQHMIFDRGHFSEVVYGDMFRGGRHFSKDELTMLNDYCRNRGIVILCDPSENELRRRVGNSASPKHINLERLGEVKHRFQQAVETSGIPYLSVDTEDANAVRTCVQGVKKRLNAKSYDEMGWDRPAARGGTP